MSINQKILNVYKNNWAELESSLKLLDADQYTNPFLICFDESLLNESDLRVMIFGQETKGWNVECVLDTPEATVAMYDEFFCKKNLYKKDFYRGYGRSKFFQGFKYFEEQLKEAYPKKSIYFSWNNIRKIGKSKGTGVSEEARAVEQKTFSVILSEVQAFNPDIVIFLTGPNKDGDIRHHFNDATFTAINSKEGKRAVAKVSSESLPIKSIRMYHPAARRGLFKKVREDALNFIVG